MRLKIKPVCKNIRENTQQNGYNCYSYQVKQDDVALRQKQRFYADGAIVDVSVNAALASSAETRAKHIREQVRVIDVREPHEYEISRIPGAELMRGQGKAMPMPRSLPRPLASSLRRAKPS